MSALQHFKLHFLAAASHVLAQAVRTLGSEPAALAGFPFLAAYRDELEELGLDGPEPDALAQQWREVIASWEESVTGHLPLRALRAATGVDHRALMLLFAAGLIDEDPRFGALFAEMQGTAAIHRPTQGLLDAWWRGPDEGGEVRARLRSLRELGALAVANPDAPRMEWALHVPGPVWDALRGETPRSVAPGFEHRPFEELERDEPLVVSPRLAASLERVPALLVSGQLEALVLRGPSHNGRRTALRSVARALGRGLLQVEGLSAGDERWRLVGVLATLLHALPAVVIDPAPGETVTLPALPGLDAPLGVVMGKQGGVSGAPVERALTLAVEMPGPEERAVHWARGLEGQPCAALEAIASTFRLTSGNIRRAARVAVAQAALAGRSEATVGDVQQASRALSRQALDTLAVRLTARVDADQLAVGAETRRELDAFQTRCRQRERLGRTVGEALSRQLTPGVRALFQGPSGTGKTLAAQMVACGLGLDLYRVDLSTVVNKYIGETEKNLARVFALAEELDVMLLFDEGDALFGKRTSVSSSNDRYANLETNYLLQRIESFEGIVVITTNAGDSMDDAFQRRLDVVVDFRPPEPAERWAIWEVHLPRAHRVEAGLLREVAARCHLSGGQIRNAVLHASLLAVEEGEVIGSRHLEEGIAREYRKQGAVCPLRVKLVSSSSAW